MAFAEEFVKENPRFFEDRPEGADLWDQVYKQSIDHTQKSDHSRLLSERRPNEPNEILDYRTKNVRNITSATVVRFTNKASRIFNSSGVSLTKGKTSDSLLEWIQSDRCYYMNQTVTFEEYAYRCLFPIAIEDPNGAVVAFPFNPENRGIAPADPFEEGGLLDTELPDIDIRVIPYSHIVLFEKRIFSYWAGDNWPFMNNNREETAKWYWVVDDEWWYQYVPVGRDDKRNIIYELRAWYRHDTGTEDNNMLPVAKLPGRIKMHKGVKYHESILSPAFEYLDEVVVSFSDTQGLRVRHQHPKEIYSDLPCMAEGCNGGKVRYRNDHGKPDIKECPECNGTGRSTEPGIFGKYMRGKSGLDKDSNVPAIEYVTPPQEPLRDCYEMTFDLFKRGNRVVGLDLITNEVESGEAKRRRLEDLADILADIGPMFFKFLGRVLFNVESLLVVNRSARIRPVIQLPVTYDTRDLEILKQDAETALSSDKMESLLLYYQRKYQNNPTLIKVYELALSYSPILVYEVDDRIQLKAAGVYDENDLIRADRAVWAFKQIAEQEGDDFLNMNDREAVEKADEIIQPFLMDEQTPIVNINGEAA